MDGRIERYDLMKLYHIHRVYEVERRRIQKLSKHKPKTSKRLLGRYSRRERSRSRDFMYKLTTSIARELKESSAGAVMGKLKWIKHNVLDRSKEWNRKISKWDARALQFMLEYKLRRIGLQARYVNSRNTSRTSPSALEA
jgi:putative transposase